MRSTKASGSRRAPRGMWVSEMTATSITGLHSTAPAPVAQWIERCPPEAEVAGSNPAGRVDHQPALPAAPRTFTPPGLLPAAVQRRSPRCRAASAAVSTPSVSSSSAWRSIPSNASAAVSACRRPSAAVRSARCAATAASRRLRAAIASCIATATSRCAASRSRSRSGTVGCARRGPARAPWPKEDRGRAGRSQARLAGASPSKGSAAWVGRGLRRPGMRTCPEPHPSPVPQRIGWGGSPSLTRPPRRWYATQHPGVSSRLREVPGEEVACRCRVDGALVLGASSAPAAAQPSGYSLPAAARPATSSGVFRSTSGAGRVARTPQARRRLNPA